MHKDNYLTVKDIADLLKVAENTVRGWVKSGDLRAIDLGKGWRIEAVDLKLFLDSKQTTPRQDTPRQDTPRQTHPRLDGATPPEPEA